MEGDDVFVVTLYDQFCGIFNSKSLFSENGSLKEKFVDIFSIFLINEVTGCVDPQLVNNIIFEFVKVEDVQFIAAYMQTRAVFCKVSNAVC